MTVNPFSKQKFQSLSKGAQHKKVAETIRQYYEWLGEEAPEEITPETLSNAYHHHLKEAGQQLKEHNLLPRVRKGDRRERTDPLPIMIYLDHIRSAHNVGSIFRTVEAFSLGTIVLSEQTPGPENKQVCDASMGTADWVPCSRDTELIRPIIALETCEEATPLHDFAFPPSFTLVVGNEEYGCSKEILKQADAIVEIPLVGRKNSLNVANALAICAAQIRTVMDSFVA